MNTKEMANRLREIAMVLSALGDFGKASVVTKAADRLERLQLDNQSLFELIQAPPVQIQAYLDYKRERAEKSGVG